MKNIMVPSEKVPVVAEVDVCVVGGSCTGVFAAVRAARLGSKVAIIEKQNCFGGVATAGIVNVWHQLYSTDGETPIIAGMTLEIIERLRQRGAVLHDGKPTSAFRLNTEELKIDLDEMIVEHQVRPFLHTFYAAPVMDGGRLDAVIVENKNGRQAIRARMFVDATGDGDLARHLGIPLRDGGNLQPPTTCAKFYGMDSLADFDWYAAIREHGHEFGLEPDWGWGGPIPGMSKMWMSAENHVFNVDVSDAEQLTLAEIEGRRRVRAIMDVIRSYGPPGSSIALADLAAAIGARETRRITARYQLTGDDVLYGRRFEDAIANGSYPVDIHHDDGPGITFKRLDGSQTVSHGHGLPLERGRWREPLPGGDPTFYQIPFRSLVQDKASNLVFAGRSLDADKVAFSAVRVMVNTNQTGEAAGVACHQAIRNDCPVSQVDPAELRRELAGGGSCII